MKTTGSTAGFTLIEVVIALGLLAFTLLGIFQMQFYAMRGNVLSQGTTSAIHLAQAQMETLLASDYTSLASIAPAPVQDAKNNSYTLTTTVAANVPLANMKTITITVSWGNGTRQCTLTSIKRQTGS